MSQSAITTAFEDYLTQQVASGGAVTLDQFIFANVPDLDPDAPIDRSEQIPIDYIVYQQAVTLPGVINNNEVVYSVTMGTEVGNFDFNWIGLVNSATSLLGMVTHAPVQQKFKNADGQQGNTLTRSFLMEYDGAATATTITTPAETWQIDFTARLAGMDERQRLENVDIYGGGAFFGDGYLVEYNPTDGHMIDAGVGYVGGLRVQLDSAQGLNATTMPVNVYVDACWKGTLTSVWNVQQQITLASDLSNYTDADGTAHYVFAVASIDANGTVTDLRPSGSKDNQALSGYLQTNNNLAEIAGAGVEAQAEALFNLGCGTAATATLTTSTADNTMGRVLKVGDRGLGVTMLPIIEGFDFATWPFAAGETLLISVASSVNRPAGIVSPSGWIYIHTTGIRNVYGDASIITTDFNTAETTFCACVTDTAGGARAWVTIKLPTSAPDVGAMPLYPTPLAVDLNTLGASSSAGVYCQVMDVDATPELNYPTTQSGTLLVTPSAYGCQQEYTTFGSGQKFTRGLTTAFDGSGPWYPWVPQFSPGNPPPAIDLSNYLTRPDALNTFLQGVRMANYGSYGSDGIYDSAHKVLTGIYATNGWDNPSTQEARTPQFNINGSWYDMAYV